MINRITIRSAEGGGDAVPVDPQKLEAVVKRLERAVREAARNRATETDAADAAQPRQLEAEA